MYGHTPATLYRFVEVSTNVHNHSKQQRHQKKHRRCHYILTLIQWNKLNSFAACVCVCACVANVCRVTQNWLCDNCRVPVYPSTYVILKIQHINCFRYLNHLPYLQRIERSERICFVWFFSNKLWKQNRQLILHISSSKGFFSINNVDQPKWGIHSHIH